MDSSTVSQRAMPAIDRGLRVLARLAADDRPVRFGELVEAAGPVTHAGLVRVLESLMALGYVRKDGAGYRLAAILPWYGGLGPRAFPSPAPLAAAQVKIDRLAARSAHSVSLWRRLGRMTMVLTLRQQAEVSKPAFSPPGRELPLLPYHGCAQVFLAWADGATQEQAYLFWSARRDRAGKTRRPTLDEYLAHLRGVRKSGVCVEDREDHPHSIRVAAAVPDRQQGAPDLVVAMVASSDVSGRHVQMMRRQVRALAGEIARVQSSALR